MNISRATGTVPGRWQKLPENLLFEPSVSLLLNLELTSPKFHESGMTSVFSQRDWLFICFTQESVLSYHKIITPTLCQLNFLTCESIPGDGCDGAALLSMPLRWTWGWDSMGWKLGSDCLVFLVPILGSQLCSFCKFSLGLQYEQHGFCYGGWITR